MTACRSGSGFVSLTAGRHRAARFESSSRSLSLSFRSLSARILSEAVSAGSFLKQEAGRGEGSHPRAERRSQSRRIASRSGRRHPGNHAGRGVAAFCPAGAARGAACAAVRVGRGVSGSGTEAGTAPCPMRMMSSGACPRAEGAKPQLMSTGRPSTAKRSSVDEGWFSARRVSSKGALSFFWVSSVRQALRASAKA